jgi:hypothetical protein
MASEFDGVVAKLNALPEEASRWKTQRKAIVAAARGDDVSKRMITEQANRIGEIRRGLNRLNEAIKNAGPALDKLERQVTLDLAQVENARDVLTRSRNDQLAAFELVLQKFNYAVGEVRQADNDFRKSQWIRVLTDLDLGTRRDIELILDRSKTFTSNLSSLIEEISSNRLP